MTRRRLLGRKEYGTVQLIRDEARERWGDEFSTVVCVYEDGSLAVEAHHVTGEDDDGCTVFEELLWHSERASAGEAYYRESSSADPDSPRNETEQVELFGEWIELGDGGTPDGP